MLLLTFNSDRIWCTCHTFNPRLEANVPCNGLWAAFFRSRWNFFLQIPCSQSSLPFPTCFWHKYLNYSFNKHRYYQKPLITSASIIVLLVYSASNQWACLYSLSLSRSQGNRFIRICDICLSSPLSTEPSEPKSISKNKKNKILTADP